MAVKDMIQFWDRLSNINHGLALIHAFQGDTSSNIPVLLGWHQDIKPANILVFSGSGTSSYDVYFKIADLSLCHFKPSEAQRPEDTDLDAFGTRAYGAPETFRPESAIDPLPVEVRRDVDVWSVGCVFSEAAVWSRYGWKRVLEYRLQRQRELKKILTLDGEHCFHDGRDVLPIVLGTHKHMAGEPRTIDQVTIDILHILDDNVLLNENESRYSAKQLFHKLKRVIRHAHVSLGPGDAGSVSDDEERPKTPPCVPPGYVSTSGSCARSSAGTRVDTSLVKPLLSNNSTSPSPSPPDINVSGQHHSLGVDRTNQHRDSDSHCRQYRSALDDQYEPPSSASSPRPEVEIHNVRRLESKKSQQEPRGPCLSLKEGLLWKERKKKGHNSALNGQENLAYLNERDHVGFPRLDEQWLLIQ